MIQPKLYYRNNGLQKNDAKYVLDNYFHLVKWKADEKEAVIDVGCGLGDITCEYLLPLLPRNVEHVVGADYSDDMVAFARSKWIVPNVTFGNMDLTAAEVPVDFEEAFHHAFSFYCLHWIQDQRRAIKNIFDVLRPGGDMLVCFIASNPIYSIYERMMKRSKWKEYMQDVKKYISPYHHCETPVKEFNDILNEAGFDCELCETVERGYTFPNFKLLKQSVIAVTPFISNIPEYLWEDYMNDYLKEVRRTKNVTIITNDNNNEEKIFVRSTIIVAYARKPL